MMADEDNFDIDIYGDGGGGEEYDDGGNVAESAAAQPHNESADSGNNGGNSVVQDQSYQNTDVEQNHPSESHGDQTQVHNAQVSQSQGMKRKDGADERPVDPGATQALFVTDLPWWVTDDDARGWAEQCGCDDELEEVTFSEHKVNGKSKGQAYILFSTPQAATATKHVMESGGDGRQKFASNYTNPLTNPFKTLPKDGNMRNASQGARSTSVGFSAGGQGQGGANTGGYRGGRGGFNSNRGGGGGYNRGGFNQNMGGNFGSGGMNNFQAGMGGMNQYGGFQNRGGMMGGGMRGGNMGMRGGRGVMNNMMAMPMGGMMGGMQGQMANMGMGMPGMGMQGTGFQNTNFFPQQNDSWNPHGAKRTRQE